MARKSRSSDAPPRRETPDEKIVRLARQRFAMAEEATEKQREREKEDLRFYAGDQWPEEVLRAREGTKGPDGRIIAPLPTITVNKTREPVKQVLNMERQSDMGAEIVPADDFGEMTDAINDDEIELREGLLRRIQRAPETADAITWGFSRAVTCGVGYFGIMTRFLKGRTFDQEPYVYRFFDQNSILLDPSHVQPDGSDAEWGFEGVDMPWDRYVAEHPDVDDGKGGKLKNPVCSYDDNAFRVATEELPGWFRTEGDLRMVRVVNYYYTERETTEYALLADGSIVEAKNVPDGEKPVDTRYDVTKKVKWCKLDGQQIIEKTDWLGPDIPIIKIVGQELHPYDEERRIEGMVRPAIETNRAENYMVSKMVWTIGNTPIPNIMMANGQDEGFEHEYATMNTRGNVLHYNAKDAEGNPVPPPFRPPVSSDLGPMVQAIAYFDEATKSATSTQDPALGNPSAATRGNAKLNQVLIAQSQLGTSDYLDNLARSVRRMGAILNGMFHPIFTNRPGRLARIVTGDGQSKTVTIGAATPSPAVEGQPPQQPPQKQYILTPDANFNVAVKVTKNSETRNDQINSMLGEMIAANPEFMTWFGDLFMKTTDSPDAKELSERAKVMLAPPIQSMLQQKDKGGPPIPPEAQQKLAQAEETIRSLSEQLNQVTEQLKTDAAKAQSAAQLADMNNAAKMQIEQLKADITLQVEQLTNKTKIEIERFKAQQATVTREDEQAHDVALASAEAAHKAEEAESAREHAAEMGEQSHLQTLEQQENAPKPKAGE